jgi:hypothetical protein
LDEEAAAAAREAARLDGRWAAFAHAAQDFVAQAHLIDEAVVEPSAAASADLSAEDQAVISKGTAALLVLHRECAALRK